MAQSENNVSPWDYFGVIPEQMGWQNEHTIDNAVGGWEAWMIGDSFTEGNYTREVTGRTALTGTPPQALAEATFHQI